MDARVAVISIVVERAESVEALNALLHSYRKWIIGRMGLPYPARDISLMSIAMDAPQDQINSLTGALGRLEGVTAKAAFAKQTN